MDAINRKQIEEILLPIERATVVRHDWFDGNFNDHCLVTTESGSEYVIRISRQGWDQTDWKVGKFMREKITADLIGDALHVATPRTFLIDGSLSVYPRVYVVQKPVKNGMLFFEAQRIQRSRTPSVVSSLWRHCETNTRHPHPKNGKI